MVWVCRAAVRNELWRFWGGQDHWSDCSCCVGCSVWEKNCHRFPPCILSDTPTASARAAVFTGWTWKRFKKQVHWERDNFVHLRFGFKWWRKACFELKSELFHVPFWKSKPIFSTQMCFLLDQGSAHCVNSPGKWHTPADGLHMFPEMVCFLFEDFLTGPPNKNGYLMS